MKKYILANVIEFLSSIENNIIRDAIALRFISIFIFAADQMYAAALVLAQGAAFASHPVLLQFLLGLSILAGYFQPHLRKLPRKALVELPMQAWMVVLLVLQFGYFYGSYTDEWLPYMVFWEVQGVVLFVLFGHRNSVLNHHLVDGDHVVLDHYDAIKNKVRSLGGLFGLIIGLLLQKVINPYDLIHWGYTTISLVTIYLNWKVGKMLIRELKIE